MWRGEEKGEDPRNKLSSGNEELDSIEVSSICEKCVARVTSYGLQESCRINTIFRCDFVYFVEDRRRKRSRMAANPSILPRPIDSLPLRSRPLPGKKGWFSTKVYIFVCQRSIGLSVRPLSPSGVFVVELEEPQTERGETKITNKSN